MFLSDQSVKDQEQTRPILNLHTQAGLDAEKIAGCLGCELAQVKAVLMSNVESLAIEFERSHEEAKRLSCADSKRLMYNPVQAPDKSFYERRILKKMIGTRGTWPNSAITVDLIRVDHRMKERVRAFSLRTFEVVETCMRRGVQKEAAIDLAADGLVVSNYEIIQLIDILSRWSKEEQEAILRNFRALKPGLLKRLLCSLAPMPKQCGLTLILTDVLREAQLISRHVVVNDFIIRGMRREWATQGHLTALMHLVLGKLYLKLNDRARVDDSLQDIPLVQLPTEEELCEFYVGLGDLHFDLQLYERAEENYQRAIIKSEDPQNLTRVQSRLEFIQNNDNYRVLAREATQQGETELAELYNQAATHLRQAKSSPLTLQRSISPLVPFTPAEETTEEQRSTTSNA
jgi:tetratricopeptide (TPR) repeat protein